MYRLVDWETITTEEPLKPTEKWSVKVHELRGRNVRKENGINTNATVL